MDADVESAEAIARCSDRLLICYPGNDGFPHSADLAGPLVTDLRQRRV
jgi:hypothetical protein